jgi:hypothetical protein
MNAPLRTAQKVRLWFAGSCQALALLLSLIAVSAFNYYPLSGSGATAANGDLIGLLVWVFLFEVAVAVLASICLYRFLRPKAVQPSIPFPPAGPYGGPPPPPPYGSYQGPYSKFPPPPPPQSGQPTQPDNGTQND